MTTIAYRDGVLAGDTRITIGDEVSNNDHRKVWRLRDGRLFGWAGSVEASELMLKALRGKAEMPKEEDLTSMLIDPEGRVYLNEGNIWVKQRPGYYAIGTGMIIALAAMDAGATAVEAVKIGIKRDIRSGGRVVSVKLK